MNIRKLIYLSVAFVAAALLWGCGSSGGGGSSFMGQEIVAPEYLGNASCLVCHNGVHTTNKYNLTGGEISHLAGIIADGDNSYYISHACEDCHGGGSAHRGIGPILFPRPDAARCATCHDEAAKVLASNHNRGDATNISMIAPGRFSANCGRCHTTERMIQNNIEPEGLLPASLHNISCAACHDSLTMEVRSVENSCANCHSDLTVYANHLPNNPFSDLIAARFAAGRHTGNARAGDCAACHSHEGAMVMFAQEVKFDTIAQIEGISAELAALGGTADLSKKTCATCHDPHSGALRGIGSETERVILGSGLQWERTLYSAEFNLCTSCHQVSLDHEFNPNAGYNNAGAFIYSLSDVYVKSDTNPDPFTNKGIGYHTNSHLNRSFVDTHFTGELYKKLYYYDVYQGYVQAGDLPGDNFVGVLYGALNRQRTARTTPPGPAYDRLVEFYNEYLAAPDNIAIKGFNVNPGSANACSACHDVHSANKLVAPASTPYPYAMNFEANIAKAIAYGEGVAENHGNYTGNAFSRNVNNANNGDMYGSTGCTPCHTGRDFVKVTKGSTFANLGAAQWNTVSCVSCHDMTASGTIIENVRTLPGGYSFAFNSGSIVDAATLGKNQVCFECHKGRTPGADVTTLPVGATNHYDISYLHYSPTFATHYGTDSGMVAEYAGKSYRGKSTTHSADASRDAGGGLTYGVTGGASCVDCHDVHMGIKESSANIRNGTTCVTCHGADWTQRAPKRNVSALAGLLIDVVYDELLATDNVGFNPSLTTFLNAVKAATPAAAKDLIKVRIKERTVPGGWPTRKLAHAVTTWKVFYYEDKASWAHNRNYTYQMLHDAIENIGGANGAAAAAAIVARPL